jgi:hypothetical protein
MTHVVDLAGQAMKTLSIQYVDVSIFFKKYILS